MVARKKQQDKYKKKLISISPRIDEIIKEFQTITKIKTSSLIVSAVQHYIKIYCEQELQNPNITEESKTEYEQLYSKLI